LKYERDMCDSFRPHLEKALAPYLEDEKKTPSRAKYTQDCKRWKAFADELQMPWRPAHPEVVCYFLLDAAEDRGASLATINRLVAAISWAHEVAGVFDPTNDALVQALLRFLAVRKKGQFLESTASAKPQGAPKVVISGSTAALEGGEIEMQQ